MLVPPGNLLKLQHLQDKVLRTIGNFPRRTQVRELHKAFNIPYIYIYIRKLCRQQAENHGNANVRNIGQAKPDTENIRGLNFVAVKRSAIEVSRLPL
jgi:hypothetical protein